MIAFAAWAALVALVMALVARSYTDDLAWPAPCSRPAASVAQTAIAVTAAEHRRRTPFKRRIRRMLLYDHCRRRAGAEA